MKFCHQRVYNHEFVFNLCDLLNDAEIKIPLSTHTQEICIRPMTQNLRQNYFTQNLGDKVFLIIVFEASYQKQCVHWQQHERRKTLLRRSNFNILFMKPNLLPLLVLRNKQFIALDFLFLTNRSRKWENSLWIWARW